MKKPVKSILSLLLCACLMVSQMNTIVLAEEEEAAEEEVPVAAEEMEEQESDSAPELLTADTVTIEIVPDVDLPDNDELFQYYAEGVLYDYEMSTFGTRARAKLNDAEKGAYDALKEQIEEVAEEGGSTIFELDDVEGLKTSWTNIELGISGIYSQDDLDLMAKLAEKAFNDQCSWKDVCTALLLDCPFDLYWYDKTLGMGRYYELTSSYERVNGKWVYTIWIKNIALYFHVADDYKRDTYVVSPNKISKVAEARENALAVVAKNKSKTTIEKLTAFKEYICKEVTYNDYAAENDIPYGDPWQLISVFDDDDDTNVVCEGYSKAFQYLCDLSGLDCISVEGQMGEATSLGAHMWNVVTLNGTDNYLVDVTNCDDGTVGAPDKLFLVGGSYDDDGYYAYTFGRQTVYYVCDDLDLANTPPKDEHVHNTDGEVSYVVDAATHTKKVACKDCPEAYVAVGDPEAHSTDAEDDRAATYTAPAYCSVCESEYGECLVLPDNIVDCGLIDGCNLTWQLTDDGTLTISGEGRMADYSTENYTIRPWEAYHRQIKKVVIEEGVTSIGARAFYYCSALTSVTIPESVTSIEDWAFYGCSSLASVTIPEGVTYLGERVFVNCSSLTSITIPEGVTSIEEGTFSGCAALASVTIPESVTSIETAAFSFCDSLTSISIPKSVTKIEDQAFGFCISLKSIVIPEAVTSIGDYVFSGCCDLTKITFTGNAPEMDDSVFLNVTATAYYPGNDDTWTEDKLQDYGGNLTWYHIPGEHNTNGEVTYEKADEINHTKKVVCLNCSDDHVTESVQPHSTDAEGDRAATYTDPAYCSVCKSEYGAPLTHTHNLDGEVSYVVDETSHTKKVACEGCPFDHVTETTEAHSTDAEDDRAATTTAPAYCSVCESEYGEVLPHEHSYTGVVTYEKKDDESHFKRVACVDCPESLFDETTEAHSTDAEDDRAATTTAPAYCSVCDSEYGEPLSIEIRSFADNIEYEIEGKVITVTSSASCKVGYMNGDRYVPILAEIDGDTRRFTIPEGVGEILVAWNGDVNLSGSVDMDDVVAMARHVLHAENITNAHALALGEVTNDVSTDMDDVVKMAQYVLKAIASLD